jgi:hypothetical protein
MGGEALPSISIFGQAVTLAEIVAHESGLVAESNPPTIAPACPRGQKPPSGVRQMNEVGTRHRTHRSQEGAMRKRRMHADGSVS